MDNSRLMLRVTPDGKMVGDDPESQHSFEFGVMDEHDCRQERGEQRHDRDGGLLLPLLIDIIIMIICYEGRHHCYHPYFRI